MNLLGHSDYRMTLRYTEVTQITVSREFFRALAIINKDYSLGTGIDSATSFDPNEHLNLLKVWIKNQDTFDGKAKLSITKKIHTLAEKIIQQQTFKSNSPGRYQKS